MSRRALLAFTLATLLPVRVVSAAQPAILLSIEDTHHPVLPLLRAELVAAGFSVMMTGPLGSLPQRLDEEARAKGATAAIALTPTATEFEVCVVDRVTGKIVFRELVTGDRSQGPWAESVSMRIVELLRAAMIEIELPQAPAGPVAPPPEVKQFVSAARSHLGIAVAPSIQLAPGGLGAMPHLRLAAAYLRSQFIRLGIETTLPLADARVSAAEGAVDVSIVRAGVFVELNLRDERSRLQPFLGAGASGGVLTMTGVEVLAPYAAASARVPFAAVEGRGGVRLELARYISVSALMTSGFSLPGIAIQVQDRRVATWGRPFFTGALTMEWLVF